VAGWVQSLLRTAEQTFRRGRVYCGAWTLPPLVREPDDGARDVRTMKIHPLLPAAVALLLGASPALAQEPPAARGELPAQADERPFERLLQVRQELQLSDAQVDRLQLIALRLEDTNAPLRAELMRQWQAWRQERRNELLRMTPEARQAELRRLQEEGPPPLPENLRPLAQRIRGNIAAAMREAGGVLTPQQKSRARALMRQQRQLRQQQGRRGRQMPRGRRP
jgi:hypothetical protein